MGFLLPLFCSVRTDGGRGQLRVLSGGKAGTTLITAVVGSSLAYEGSLPPPPPQKSGIAIEIVYLTISQNLYSTEGVQVSVFLLVGS